MEAFEAMTSALDIYRSAKLLIDQHSVKAAHHAAMNAEKCLERKDFDGQAVWMRVVVAIKELQDQDWPQEDHDWPQEDRAKPRDDYDQNE